MWVFNLSAQVPFSFHVFLAVLLSHADRCSPLTQAKMRLETFPFYLWAPTMQWFISWLETPVWRELMHPLQAACPNALRVFLERKAKVAALNSDAAS